jgi:hypothetical protein
MKFKKGDYVKYWNTGKQKWVYGTITKCEGSSAKYAKIWSFWENKSRVPGPTWMRADKVKRCSGLERAIRRAKRNV